MCKTDKKLSKSPVQFGSNVLSIFTLNMRLSYRDQPLDVSLIGILVCMF